MTKEEAFLEITSKPKWYLWGGIKQSYASVLVQRFHAGWLKEKTIDEILHKFGYELMEPAQYRKINPKT